MSKFDCKNIKLDTKRKFPVLPVLAALVDHNVVAKMKQPERCLVKSAIPNGRQHNHNPLKPLPVVISVRMVRLCIGMGIVVLN